MLGKKVYKSARFVYYSKPLPYLSVIGLSIGGTDFNPVQEPFPFVLYMIAVTALVVALVISANLNTFHNRETVKYLDNAEYKGIPWGSKVRIIGSTTSFKKGWDNMWDDDMGNYIGKKGYVVGINSEHGAPVVFKDGRIFMFPHYLIEVQ